MRLRFVSGELRWAADIVFWVLSRAARDRRAWGQFSKSTWKYSRGRRWGSWAWGENRDCLNDQQKQNTPHIIELFLEQSHATYPSGVFAKNCSKMPEPEKIENTRHLIRDTLSITVSTLFRRFQVFFCFIEKNRADSRTICQSQNRCCCKHKMIPQWGKM